MIQQADVYDITIIGGGPVGLFTAFYSGMREMKTKIIEFLPYLGGKVPYFYPEKIIRDIGGIPMISGEKLTEDLIKQAMTFDPTIVLNEQVTNMERLEDGTFLLTSNNGAQHYTKTIVLATGFGSLKSVKLDIDNAVDFEERSLHYSIKKLESYRDKNVLISGGGNSAVDWANELEPIANNVTLIYRKPAFTGIESNVSKMMNSSVEVLNPYELVELKGTNGQISSALVKQVAMNATKEIAVDNVIVNHGFEINLGSIAEWGMDMENGTILVDQTMSTSLPGIFAIGDVANYPNKLALIAGGFNEGPIAVNSAKQFILPHEPLKHLFSTHYEPLTLEN
ncbi:thioredoxin reductase [Oceanobacillus sp. 143]|uniref:Ferredoxin--NADP reductase n=1 Tax=Oceanobacillus zhaokaii TaxID=2052660 RepID=A0A345PCW9_9BACI|nr:NAD(P)/FAD-dependent oxidoreductase [Oceanobacillus zhaokaii]AXI07849.1 thioredoxin reductase [Oceanobacillus zhaokaii]QGS67945.1 thioredoxin reductase [Oceanobacillus sp. 143]